MPILNAASSKYTEAFFYPRSEAPREARAALLCNRAACNLRLARPQDCIDDCSAAIEMDPSFIKAYYRRAQALLAIGEPSRAVRDLTYLLRLDAGNKEAATLLREASKTAQAKAADDSEVARALKVIATASSLAADAAVAGKDPSTAAATPKSESKEDGGKRVDAALKHLVSLCHDDLGHTTELLRRGGVSILKRIIAQRGEGAWSDPHLVTLCLRVLLACAQHKSFVTSAITLQGNSDDLEESLSPSWLVSDMPPPAPSDGRVGDGGTIDLSAVTALIAEGSDEASRAATSLALKIIQVYCPSSGISLFSGVKL
jgi:tetratricopeptide (TPR) repeat protein